VITVRQHDHASPHDLDHNDIRLMAIWASSATDRCPGMADSNVDSNSSSQRLIATTGDNPQRSHDGASTWRTPRLKSGRSMVRVRL
jgi:hypothetical protein